MATLPRYAREKIAEGRNSINSAFDNPGRRMSDKCRFFQVTSRQDLGLGDSILKIEETDGNLWNGPQMLKEWEMGIKDGKVEWYGTPEGIAAFMERFGAA